MARLRKFHFVIHNQGSYDSSKKDALLAYLKDKYGASLEGYLIAQESYKHDPTDTHLQGNLFFVNALQFQAVLKYLKLKYKETRTDQGLNGRIDLSQVLHEGRAYNYMVNSKKEGGDPEPISDCSALDGRRAKQAFIQDLQVLMDNVHQLVSHRQYVTTVWPADGPDAPPYVAPTALDWHHNHL